LDEEDVQIAVSAADSSRSSWRQSASPSTIPGTGDFGGDSFPLEKKFENILLRLLLKTGEVGLRDIIAWSVVETCPVSANKDTLSADRAVEPLNSKRVIGKTLLPKTNATENQEERR
jgi:hypothetical protein